MYLEYNADDNESNIATADICLGCEQICTLKCTGTCAFWCNDTCASSGQRTMGKECMVS